MSDAGESVIVCRIFRNGGSTRVEGSGSGRFDRSCLVSYSFDQASGAFGEVFEIGRGEKPD